MSYCRFGWDGSQVYVFGTTRNRVDGLECCGCLLDRELGGIGDYFVETEARMVDHLMEHRSAGHTVPQYALDRLAAERDGREWEFTWDGEQVPPRNDSVTCPRCGRTSYHPKDREEGYCGACHDWTGTPMKSLGGDQ